ncbi:omega-6 fatty acid desaturase (delta-12 desaturase) [Colletotrichum scovillei]|uniref:Omega-6 fatty acid desaturase (Delta-12 desaturase) n=1 Tax=Colletotrichum scovillei TaxID=1209932 RepID=A0A9P7QUM3_9PEZI|nr:omega-6 fatty acid desaturase (delta-12 desaturase) [Colletotrichum scovillei]KAG7041418.1 omega-6 fatty acid desaturase (delta-12 desaturase) [Colletotrichum scovillei]KAG7061445.1 omega-6 fatty acid desaturase (delta-12 desaturase) [Colletotrichum scovillei]
MQPDYPDIQDLRKAIPLGCFLPCPQTSLYYISRDVLASAVLVYFAFNYIREDQLGPTLYFIAWAAYSFLQGLVCTGIWVLAHECGHGSLFASTKLNDGIGFVLHSFLMVPYFSWKYTHRRHHRFTGHATRDVAFVPAMKQVDSDRDIFSPSGFMEDSDVPIVQAISLLGQQLFGWPLHALFNLSAGKDSLMRDVSGTERWLRVSLFDPWSSVFRDNEAWSVLASDCGLGLMGCILGWCGQEFGSKTMILLYLLPYLWVNNWLVAITYLQHNHPQVPHYTDEGWTFTKGALSTIDRDFGFVGRHFFHLIIDRHVVHHLFPRIPFYKTDAATTAIKPLLGGLYRYEGRSFLGQLWYQSCTLKYMENDPDRPGYTRWTL